MVLLADRTPSRPLRHTLLHVLQAALLPASASLPQPAGSAQSPVVALAAAAAGGNRAEASAAVTANCAAFLAAGGVHFAVDLLASAPFVHHPNQQHSCPGLCRVLFLQQALHSDMKLVWDVRFLDEKYVTVRDLAASVSKCRPRFQAHTSRRSARARRWRRTSSRTRTRWRTHGSGASSCRRSPPRPPEPPPRTPSGACRWGPRTMSFRQTGFMFGRVLLGQRGWN